MSNSKWFVCNYNEKVEIQIPSKHQLMYCKWEYTGDTKKSVDLTEPIENICITLREPEGLCHGIGLNKEQLTEIIEMLTQAKEGMR